MTTLDDGVRSMLRGSGVMKALVVRLFCCTNEGHSREGSKAAARERIVGGGPLHAVRHRAVGRHEVHLVCYPACESSASLRLRYLRVPVEFGLPIFYLSPVCAGERVGHAFVVGGSEHLLANVWWEDVLVLSARFGMDVVIKGGVVSKGTLFFSVRVGAVHCNVTKPSSRQVTCYKAMSANREDCNSGTRSTPPGAFLWRFARVNDRCVNLCGKVARSDSARRTLLRQGLIRYAMREDRPARNEVAVVFCANRPYAANICGNELRFECKEGTIYFRLFFFQFEYAGVARRIRPSRYVSVGHCS